jgi:hypothetical protein
MSKQKNSARAVAPKYKKHKTQTLDSLFKSMSYKARVMEKPQSDKERKLQARYLKEKEVETQVAQLLNLYGPAGLTRARAVQAVKTDKVADMQAQWNHKLQEWKKVQDALKRGRMGDLLG